MLIRDVVEADWPAVVEVVRAVVADGRTYAYPEDLTDADARALWSAAGRTVVVVDGEQLLGTAQVGPNRPGRGAHVATASVMVAPGARGRGVGRALGEHLVAWCREQGFRSIQFNAVVETNTAAVALWRSLGFEVVGTVPEAFDHRLDGLVGLHVMLLRLR